MRKQNETRAAGRGTMEVRSFFIHHEFLTSAVARVFRPEGFLMLANLSSTADELQYIYSTESAFPAPFRTGSKSRSGHTTATVATRCSCVPWGT